MWRLSVSEGCEKKRRSVVKFSFVLRNGIAPLHTVAFRIKTSTCLFKHWEVHFVFSPSLSQPYPVFLLHLMWVIFLTPAVGVGCRVGPGASERGWSDGSRSSGVHQSEPKRCRDRTLYCVHRGPLLIHNWHSTEEPSQVHRPHRGRYSSMFIFIIFKYFTSQLNLIRIQYLHIFMFRLHSSYWKL